MANNIPTLKQIKCLVTFCWCSRLFTK